MEYNPRYPQPFSFSQAIALDPAVAWDEIARLGNSLLHLRRSQDELQEYLRGLASEEEDLEVSQAVKENEITMQRIHSTRPFVPKLTTFRASQDERIFMLRLALTHHGYSVPPEQSSHPLTSSPTTLPGCRTEGPQIATGLDDFASIDGMPAVNQDTAEALEQGNGVYL